MDPSITSNLPVETTRKWRFREVGQLKPPRWPVTPVLGGLSGLGIGSRRVDCGDLANQPSAEFELWSSVSPGTGADAGLA